MVRVLPLLALLPLSALCSPAIAQDPPAQIYLFNRLPGDITFKVDDRPPVDVPAMRIQFMPITPCVHDLVVTLPDGVKISENHFFDPGGSFASGKSGRWICLIVGIRQGEQEPELVRMQPSSCGQLIEAR